MFLYTAYGGRRDRAMLDVWSLIRKLGGSVLKFRVCRDPGTIRWTTGNAHCHFLVIILF